MQRQPQQILEYLHESGTHSENVHASADAPASHFQAIGPCRCSHFGSDTLAVDQFWTTSSVGLRGPRNLEWPIFT